MSNDDWCADPGAWWIPQRLKRLQQVRPISQPVHDVTVFVFIIRLNSFLRPQFSLTNTLDELVP